MKYIIEVEPFTEQDKNVKVFLIQNNIDFVTKESENTSNKKAVFMELKDYAHLYLGCEILTTDGRIVNLNLTNLGFIQKELIGSGAPKLILRPLSDMKEDEKQNVNAYSSYFKPESVRYLLSKHFDIFGLIEAGLAIDAAKVMGSYLA